MVLANLRSNRRNPETKMISELFSIVWNQCLLSLLGVYQLPIHHSSVSLHSLIGVAKPSTIDAPTSGIESK